MAGGESAKKLFAKSQPLETFQWKEHSDAPLAFNCLALQQCSQGHVFASERECILTSSRGCDDDVDSNDLENSRSSRNIKTEAVPDGSLNDVNFMNVAKGSDALEGSISCSECSHHPSETDYSDLKKSENVRCSGEQMEGYSRIPSKSNSVQSLTGHEHSLGKTLATSLKLIATNSATSPLAHSSVHSDGESFQAETVNCTSTSNASDAVTPVVPSPAEPSGQSDNATVRKYPTKASLKKAEKLSKLKSRDFEKMKPILRKDGSATLFQCEKAEKLSKLKSHDFEKQKPILPKDASVTLFQCEKCSKVFNKKQTLRQHFITHTYCDTRCKSKGDHHCANADSAKADSTKADSAKADSADVESAKADNENAHCVKADNAKADSANTDSAKADSANTDSAKADNENADSAKADSANADSANADGAKAESPKACKVLKGKVRFSCH